MKQILRSYKLLLPAIAIAAFLFVFAPSTTHAATIDVAAGNDENTDNASCSLTEAIENINDQATTNTDCSPTGAYGTDDTINLPAGTITLTAGLPDLTESMTIAGQGIGVSIIDGDDGTYEGFYSLSTGSENLEFNAFTIQRVTQSGVRVANANLTIDQLEIYGASDLVGSNTDLQNGIQFVNIGGHDLSLEVTNTHIHHLIDSDDMQGILVEGGTVTGGSIDVVLSNIAINNLEGTNAVTTNGIALTQFDGVGHTMDVDMSNITISNIVGGQSATGIATVAVAGTADSTMTTDAHNITITGIVGSTSPFGGSGAISVAGGQADNSLTALVNTTVANLLLADNTEDGSPANCLIADLTPLFMGTGTPTLNLASSGGNLSDDTSCSSYFAQPSDQNNVANLASTLGTLGDYGGYVPTIPLLEGSPAIDAGVTVAGLTTDARGVNRPLGLAYDSGAYESPFTQSTESTESLASTGQGTTLYTLTALAALTLSLSFFLTTRKLHS